MKLIWINKAKLDWSDLVGFCFCTMKPESNQHVPTDPQFFQKNFECDIIKKQEEIEVPGT